MTVGIFGTVLVVLAVLIIVLISVTGNKATTKPGPGDGMKIAPASVVNAISNVSPSTFAAAGSTPSTSYGPYINQFASIKKQPALTTGGKPEVVYVGANWCPYCAATRWPLVVALSRFGTFTGLRITSSSSIDSYPSTPTVSFYGSTYTSRYISSSSDSLAVRECNGYLPLQHLSKTVAKIFDKYDAPPCVPTKTDDGSFPFMDFANKVFECGAFLNPTILGGFTQVQVAESLSNPLASPAQTILVGANFYSAIICSLTGDQPKSVCTMPVVKQAAAQLKL
jgi:thiol-disulfide isomerase/thioredoxin